MRQLWSSLSIAAALVALGTASGVGQSEETQPPALAALPPNTWVKLDPGHNPVGHPNGVRGILVYVSELRGFVFLNTVSAGSGGVGGVTETWVYRHLP